MIPNEYESAATRWTLAFALLIGTAVADTGGGTTLLALPFALNAVLLAAVCDCYTPTNDNNRVRARKPGDLIAFLRLWMEALELLAAAAATARAASATIDYISDGRLRQWLLGIEARALCEPWPDTMGVTIIVVFCLAFMLGLKKTTTASVMLISSVIVTWCLFIGTGASHTAISFKEWKKETQVESVESVLTASAMCCYAFPSNIPKYTHNDSKKPRLLIFILLPLITYLLSVLMFTFMSHHKELHNTLVPVLKVFELRDVNWARFVMAICIIMMTSLALLQSLPRLFDIFILLASTEWRIFLSSMQYKSTFTGAPILSIFAAGSLTAILAFACPLSYLIKILNISILLKGLMVSLQILSICYKPNFNTDFTIERSSTKYSALNVKKEPTRSNSRIWSCIRRCKKKTNDAAVKNTKNEKKGEAVGDKEYLLLDDYCSKSTELYLSDDESSEQDEPIENSNNINGECSDDSGSTTDIDAIVEEYRDRIQVQTIDNFDTNQQTACLTTTITIILLTMVVISTISLAYLLRTNNTQLVWLCLIIISISTIIIVYNNKKSFGSKKYVQFTLPFCAISALVFTIVLSSMLMDYVWPGIVFWIFSGILMFCKWDFCTFHSKTNLNITENKIVDTILISR